MYSHARFASFAASAQGSATPAPKSVGVHRAILGDFGGYATTIWKDGLYFITSPARFNRNTARWLGGIALVTGAMYVSDQHILDAFRDARENRFYKPFLEVGRFFEPVGHMGITNKYYFAGLTIGTVLRIKPVQNITFQILESHLIAGLFKNLANMVVGRFRPFENRGPRYFEFNGGTSFPSGHASTIFQLATILSHHADTAPATVLFYGIATTVALQRIDARSHWPSDVFVAALYGTIVSKTIIKLHENRKLNLSPGFSPNSQSFGLTLTFRF